MSNRESLLEKLNDVHTFPGPYLFKVIGPNSDVFMSRVIQGVINASGPDLDHEVTTRESSGGNHLSLSITIQARDAEHVIEVYDILMQITDVKFVL